MENEKKSLKDLMDENIFEKDNEEIIELPISKIKPNPYQPRQSFDLNGLEELGKSIKEHGVIQPIIVKPNLNEFIVIAGERRLRASKMIGLDTIPAIVRSYDRNKTIELALIENLQRNNLSALDEALAYKLMMNELSYTQEMVAKKVGKSRSYITNMLGILKLPQEVLSLLKSDKISSAHARCLSKLKSKERMIDLAHLIVMKGLSVRALEEVLRDEEKRVAQKKTKKHHQFLTKNLNNNLKVKIQIDDKKIIIRPKNEEEKNQIINWIMKEQ